MPIVLFSDHLADVRGHLRQVQKSKNGCFLVESFLEKAYAALREEVCTLPYAARAQIPVFNSVYDLSERYESSKPRRLEISCALLCVCQLAYFIGHYEQCPSEVPKPEDDLIVGFGIGQLSAAAVACSNSIVDLTDLATEAVRLAFRVGAMVGRVSISSLQSNETNASWSVVVPGTAEVVGAALQTSQAQTVSAQFIRSALSLKLTRFQNIPASERAYISIINQATCTVSGRPSRLKQLIGSSKFFQDAQIEKFPTIGYWHAAHIYSQDQVSEVLESRVGALTKFSLPCRSILSTVAGDLIAAASVEDLFTKVVTEILTSCVEWTAMRSTILEISRTSPRLGQEILGFERDLATRGLHSLLELRSGEATISRDLLAWCATDASFRSRGSAINSNIAIVGMSGRFPGASDVDALWELLEQGQQMHREVPKDRFSIETHYDATGKKPNTSHTPYGCFIEQPGLFDPRFFNMSPREAAQTDPMHRLALVTAYEALELSGFVLNRTPSTQQDRVGTFYGQTSDDWREVNAAQNIETYFIPGGVRAFAPGRISYYFGFRGPSYSVDTACSSSLAAIQVACTSLRTGECDTAVAGGLNVLTAPDIFAGLSRGQFLSKTGACKTWDIKADGYCRADGVGSIVMKRIDDAIADKDNILGVILATATNHSADAISITHPHAGNQAYLYESVLHSAGLDPFDISYVEMHGTGTQAGDVTEMRSVTDVFAPEEGGRRRDQPLYIGAIKSIIGHGEAAAGVAALIKILLMFQRNLIPPHVGIENELNPEFPNLDNRNVRIPFSGTDWSPMDGKPRLAFLNNFSAAGGNTAMLLREGPPRATPSQTDPRTVLPFVVSSKSLSSLQRNIQQLIAYAEQAPEVSFASLSYTLTSRRMHHNYRIGLAASNFKALSASLSARLCEQNFAPVSSKLPKTAFVFTGQGAFYPNLGRHLFEQSLLFRSEILRLDHIVVFQGLPSFLVAIQGNADTENKLSTLVIQLALVCVQMALVKLWQSWGIQPSAVIGHSLGEYAALNAAGVLSSDDTIHLVGNRAKLLQETCTAGTHTMLAVKASLGDVRKASAGLFFEVACLNSPADTVLCGTVDTIKKLSRALSQAGHKNMALNLPYAFHSAHIEPILEDLGNLADGAIFNKPTIPVISPLLGQVVKNDGIFDSTYISRHARETVKFFDAIEAAFDHGTVNKETIFIELGPHPACSSMIKATLGSRVCTVASLHKAEDVWKTLSTSLCSLHCTGLPIDWSQFHRDFESSHELLSLPTYSFDNKNYWIDYVNDWCLHKAEPRPAQLVESVKLPPKISTLSTSSVHRVVFEEFKDDTGKVVIQSDLADPLLRAAILGHLVNSSGLCPSSIYADIGLTLGNYVYRRLRPQSEEVGMNCGKMEVVKPLIVKEGITKPQVLQVTILANLKENLATLRYVSIDPEGRETVLHAACTIAYEDRAAWVSNWATTVYLIEGRIETLKTRVTENKADQISRGLAYKLFSALVQYDAKFQGMEEVIFDSRNYEATSRVKFQTNDKDGTFFCSPFWIDSLAHLSGFILNGSDAVDSRNFVYISHGWKSMRFARPLARTTTYNSYVKMQPGPNDIMAGDVYILEGSVIVGVVGGLKFQRIPRRILDSLLPPTSSPTPKSGATIRQPERIISPDRPVETKPLPKIKPKVTTEAMTRVSQMKFSTRPSLLSRAMGIIAQESELPLTELQDDCEFFALGVDSLMSLQISGKFRETFDIDIPSTIFLEYPTVGELKVHLQQFDATLIESSTDSPSASPEDTEDESPISPTSSIPSVYSFGADDKPLSPMPTDRRLTDIPMLFRTVIADQMGIALEEVVGSNDLHSLGMDSLMSISILGILREETGLIIPSSLFQEHPSIDAIEGFLGLNQPRDSISSKPSARQKTKKSANFTPATPSARAVSILMQGKPRYASKTLFLFPDGSGSATSYASIPAIGPDVAVYGLNCPFMTNPSDFVTGIEGVSALYLDEVRRRQPHGPYYLGGWSAGGVIAYEVTLQLLAAGERVGRLVLFDSPCPIKLEPLPSRLHHFFAEIGLLGGDGPEPPSWLLPHFEASIKALAVYEAAAIADKSLAPKTLAIWARHGVCHYPEDPRPKRSEQDPKTMKWLLENRTDFGSNGWDALLGADAIETTSLDGNHFTLMKGAKQLRHLSSIIRDFL
ncbi:hypothetical protein MMC30_009335 [Trapelia coarctata]|nr:hypothetical protein [Trapelia coarctata]